MPSNRQPTENELNSILYLDLLCLIFLCLCQFSNFSQWSFISIILFSILCFYEFAVGDSCFCVCVSAFMCVEVYISYCVCIWHVCICVCMYVYGVYISVCVCVLGCFPICYAFLVLFVSFFFILVCVLVCLFCDPLLLVILFPYLFS